MLSDVTTLVAISVAGVTVLLAFLRDLRAERSRRLSTVIDHLVPTKRFLFAFRPVAHNFSSNRGTLEAEGEALSEAWRASERGLAALALAHRRADVRKLAEDLAAACHRVHNSVMWGLTDRARGEGGHEMFKSAEEDHETAMGLLDQLSAAIRKG